MFLEYDGGVIETIPVVPSGEPVLQRLFTRGDCVFVVFCVSGLLADAATIGILGRDLSADESVVVDVAPGG